MYDRCARVRVRVYGGVGVDKTLNEEREGGEKKKKKTKHAAWNLSELSRVP